MKLKQLEAALKRADKEHARDTGLALLLIILLSGVFLHNELYFMISIPVLILVMVVPGLFSPISRIWMGASKGIGNIFSRIFLTTVFFVIITPMALVRKLFGKDPLLMKGWKKDTGSAFKTRNHVYTRDDLEKPF